MRADDVAKEEGTYKKIEAKLDSTVVPVIAYDVGGLPDLIQNGYNGYLISPGNIFEIIEKVNLILNNKDLFDKLSANAKKSVKNRYESDVTAQKTFEAYVTILKKDD